MRFGLFGINLGACADPEAAVRVARAAEAAGFDSLWTGEHVVLPDPQQPPSPSAPGTPFLDPAVALSFVAAHTRKILLATGIIILPQRNPLVLAKEIASLDVLSKGRAVLGIGAGYLHQEFRALGIPFERRGDRTDEYLDAIRALWTLPQPRFAGEFVSFEGIDAHPRPIQKPGPPIVVGGASPGALRRAVRRGNGWYGFAMDPVTTAHCLEGLARARDEVPRPAELGPLEISVTPPPGLDEAGVRRYAELGVDRLVLLGMHPEEGRLLRFVEESVTKLFPAAR
jgi:probable F420-dependent oxidoreductase